MKKLAFLTILLTFGVSALSAQDIIRLGKRTVNKVERKVESGINRGIDRSINDAEKEIKNSTKGKKDSKSKTSTSSGSKSSPAESSGVQEKYDFKPLSKSIYSFQADKLNDQAHSSSFFSQETEIVSLEGQKLKWVKMEPNMAYGVVQDKSIQGNYAVESTLIPQINFDHNDEINIGFALVSEADYNQMVASGSLEASSIDSLSAFTSILINKPKSKDDINIVTKTKKEGPSKPQVKSFRYVPGESTANKNTFAFSRTGTITKVYYCNKKITSFQDAEKEPRKLILFVQDDSAGSSLYVHNLNVTTVD